MTTQEDFEGTPSSTQIEIQELWRKLQEAELTETIRAASNAGVLNVVPSTESAGNSRLRPTVYFPVEVNGILTNALMDTGSPATTVSLQFILKVLAKLWSDETDEQWREATRKKFHDPDVILKSYGGQQLDSMAQIEVSLSQGDRETKKTVLVRKDTPNDLLIGTDVHPELGFSLAATESTGKATDLFAGGEVTVKTVYAGATCPRQSRRSCQSRRTEQRNDSSSGPGSTATPSCPDTSCLPEDGERKG